MAVIAKTEKDKEIQKNTIQRSFSTLEYCMSQDVRVNYHALTYARNAVRYYEKFGKDEFLEIYANNAITQLEEILNSKEYIYKPNEREMRTLIKGLQELMPPKTVSLER